MIKRLGPLEFWIEEPDAIYHPPWNVGIQISLTTVALLLGRWTMGVWLHRYHKEEE